MGKSENSAGGEGKGRVWPFLLLTERKLLPRAKGKNGSDEGKKKEKTSILLPWGGGGRAREGTRIRETRRWQLPLRSSLGGGGGGIASGRTKRKENVSEVEGKSYPELGGGKKQEIF